MAGFVNPGRIVGAPGNFAQSGRLGFAVGDPAFLDSEESKVLAYWREIEYGTARFVGHVITGLWSDESGPRGGLITGGELSTFGEGAGQQKLVPFVNPQSETVLGARRALGYLIGTGQISNVVHRTLLSRLKTGDLRVPTAGVIRNAIIAQDAYAEAFKSFEPGLKERDAVIQVLKDTGFVSGGFRSGAHGKVSGGQSFTRFADVRFRQRGPISSAAFRARTGFLTGGATSGFTASLVNFDRTFQAQLTDINRLLAEGLAQEVARIQQDKLKRTLTSSGRLIAATLSPKNRFPS